MAKNTLKTNLSLAVSLHYDQPITNDKILQENTLRTYGTK